MSHNSIQASDERYIDVNNKPTGIASDSVSMNMIMLKRQAIILVRHHAVSVYGLMKITFWYHCTITNVYCALSYLIN